jgi:hypothetical protein
MSECTSYTTDEFVEILRANGFPQAEVWDTGSGCMNPVIPLEYSRGDCVRYVLFSDGWWPEEASLSLMEERTSDTDAIVHWFVASRADGSVVSYGDGTVSTNVPMEPHKIVELIETVAGIRATQRPISDFGVGCRVETLTYKPCCSFEVEPGVRGTIVDWQPDLVSVRCDNEIEGLDSWDNELVWEPDDMCYDDEEDEMAHRTETFLQWVIRTQLKKLVPIDSSTD